MPSTTPAFALVSLVIGLVAIAVHTRGQRGAFFAPFNLLLLILVSIYAVRPLFLLQDRDFSLYGRNFATGFNYATALGLIAIVALVLGYTLASRNRDTSREVFPDQIGDPDPAIRYSMYRAAAIGAVLIGAWALYMASLGGGFGSLSVLFEGRNADTRSTFASVPVFVDAMPAAAALLTSAARVLVERERRLYPGEWLAFWVTVVAAIVPPLGFGGRRYLLPCLVAVAIAVTVTKYKQAIQLRHLGAGLVGFVFLAIVPFVRSTGNRGNSTNIVSATFDYFGREGLTGSLRPFFVSYDTEMFDYVGLLVQNVGTTISYGLGRGTIGDALLNPFPAGVQPAPLWSNQVLTSIFGGGCAAGGVCPVPSVVGVLYYDLGIIGVAVGMFAIGHLARRFPTSLAAAADSRLVAVLGVAAFVPVLARGNTVNVGYIMLLTIVIAASGLRACRGRADSPATRFRGAPGRSTYRQARTKSKSIT